MIDILDEKLRRENVKNYFLQSMLAALILFFALNLPFVSDAVLIAAIGSTAFVAFAMPKRTTARPRNIIGSHFVTGLIGFLFAWLSALFLPELVAISLGLGVAIFAMVTLDLEHPPAGGTVIFVILTPNIEAFIILMFLATLMAVISYVLKPYLKDLV
ncbi:MAG: HPP family protein [Thermoplasmata archaeon]